MATDLFTFTWQVPVSGFQWVNVPTRTSAGRPVRALVQTDEPRSLSQRRYDPLTEHPALFRAFASTVPTEEGILAFANCWGALGEWDVVTAGKGGRGAAALVGRQAELLSVWVQAISEMRQAVWIWNTLTSASREEQLRLREHVWWERDVQGYTHVLYDSHPELPRTQTWTTDGFLRVFAIVASDQFGEEGLSQFEQNELAMPARAFLLRLVNRNLHGRASPRLFADVRSEKQFTKNLPLLGSLRLVPSNLFACLWLQLAQAVSSDKEQRLCQGCGEWFEVKSKGVRSDRVHCSEACRKRAHRERQAHARRLHAEGRKPKEIAEELSADVAQIKKWIASMKG